MNLHNKNSSTLSLYSLRGKSWSYFQKHITNLLELDNESDDTIGSPTTNNTQCEHRADVQRLDIKDYELYGISPSDPGPMVLCNQCSHIMAPEGIARHVKRVHGTKIVPAASSKSRIAMLLASRAHSTTGSVFASNSNASITNNSLSNNCSTSSLTTAFSNRLNLSKMAPPGKSLNNDECKPQPPNSTAPSINSMPAISSNSVHSSISAASASTLSSSSNSNSPTSSMKTVASGSSSNGGRRNRKILPIKYREYDPEKHCGVTIGNMKPCTRSLTCKTHQISLRRNVDGRSKPFDQLLAEHRNNAKDGVPKSSSGRQLNSLDNSNQLALDSIADSNSSSSFDLERRSFSSNSNQSSYNNEHVYPPQTPSNQSMSSLTLMSSSASTATVTTAPAVPPNLTMSRKPLQPSFAIDDTAMNNTAIETMDSVNSSASIMQIQMSNNPNASIAATSNLNNLSDYSVQINQLNDLIDDDNGDCLDMSFWESFDNNFTYENDLLATNSSQTQQQQHQHQHQQQQQSNDAKAGVKRSMTQIYEASLQDSSVDRKRKRGNVSPAIKSNIRERLKKSPNSQERAISMIAAEIAHSSATFDAKPNTTATIPNGSIFRDQMATAHNSGSASALQDKRDATITKKKSTVNIKKNESIGTSHEKKQKSSTSPESIRLIGHSDDSHTTHQVHSDASHVAPVASSRLNVKVQDTIIPIKRQEIDDGEDDDSCIQLMAEAPQPLQTMILSSSDDIVQSTDLKIITKILSEDDHRPTPAHATTGDSKSQTINAVPIDENENYLLDIVYKCLRGKGDRSINSNYSNGGTVNTNATVNGNSSSTSSGSIGNSHRNTGTGSRISSAIGVDKEKENALDQQSDDECVTTFPASSTSTTSGVSVSSGGSSNSLLIPAAQRYSTKIHHVGLPRPIDTNRFGMARGRGICQFKHAIDSTKKTQQQIFHRLQSQQPNGTTYSGSFSSAGMIALRNNGSLMRFNSANLISSGICGNLSSVAANNGIAIGTAKNTSTITASEQNAMGKGAAKKSSSTATNATGSGVVLVNADTSSSTSSNTSNAPMAANQTHYAILRRQPTAKQSMQILSTRAVTSEPTNFSVMPVIHRVRARTMTPHVPKNLQAQTDALLQSLPKSLRAKMLASTLLAMAAKQPITTTTSSSSSTSSSATQSNVNPIAAATVSNANSSLSTTSSNSSHNTVKSSATVRQPSKLSHTSSSLSSHKSSLSTSISSSTTLKNVKQNGHYSATGNLTGNSGGDSIYTMNSLSRNLSNSSGSGSPSYHRSGSNHRSTASLLQMQNSPSIDSLILPKIIS